MTELQVFENMIDYLKSNYNFMYRKFLKLIEIEERKQFMQRAVIFRLGKDPDYIVFLPYSLLKKLNESGLLKKLNESGLLPKKVKLYDGKDEKINKLVNKIGGTVSFVMEI